MMNDKRSGMVQGRRRWLAFALVAGAGAIGGARVFAQASDPVIKVAVTKFAFTPNTIKLRKGVPVVLEFTPADVVMGFSAPDFKVRTDIFPGKVAQLRVVADKTGTFPFFCDIFCGSGHEDMSGTFVVEG